MSPTRTSSWSLAVATTLILAAAFLWLVHARSSGLGERSPGLGYDAAQVAVAARELAEHGRLATIYALPVELSTHATPPWPLALLQPGLVVAEAALFKIGAFGIPRDAGVAAAAHRIEWLALALPFVGYLATGLLLAFAALRLIERHAPDLSPSWRAAAALAIGLLFLLDPEAQHSSVGGFTELPFTFGLALALTALACGFSARRPFVFGLLLGAAGWFGGGMPWLAPVLALAAAFAGGPSGLERIPRQRIRLVRFALALGGYAIAAAPWWIYDWIAFGSPTHDMSALSLWIVYAGHTWFSIHHLPERPAMPSGGAALAFILGKLAANIPKLTLDLATGLRPLWLGAIVIWAAATRRADAHAVAGMAIVTMMALGVVAAAAGDPILRHLFPARVLLETAGLITLWALIARVPSRPGARRALQVAIALVALSWGGWLSVRVDREARAGSERRGVPTSAEIGQLAARLDDVVPPGEIVMSNLGPWLAWSSRRPVLDLALTPDDVAACRRYVDFRHVLLVFRDAEDAWPGWGRVIERPAEAVRTEEWNIHQTQAFLIGDGFHVVWLELRPRAPSMALEGGGAGDPTTPAVRGVRDPVVTAGLAIRDRPPGRASGPPAPGYW